MKTVALFGLALVCLITPAVYAASDNTDGVERTDASKGRVVSLSIEGISASIGEDEPRVLTIIPWRAPTLPRRPRAELERSAPALIQPLDPVVFERHRKFRQSLGVASDEGSNRPAGGRQ